MNQSTNEPIKNDKREIFGWVMYDWANSAYYTTVLGVLLATYLTGLAQADLCKDVPELLRQDHPCQNGVVLDLGFFAVTAKSMTSTATTLGVILQAFLMVFLGALADYSSLKKFFMAVLCYLGVAGGALLFFIEGDNYLLGCVLLIFSNVCIATSLVFYNAFLPEITSEDRRDAISARGFGFGYLGGAVLLGLNFLLLGSAEQLGITTTFAVRICLLSAALWWGGFAIITFLLLKSRPVEREIPADKNFVTVAFSEIAETFRQMLKLRYTLFFLLAYIFYNDGVQTVIYQASIFIDQELFRSKGLPSSPAFLILLFLVTQLVAMIGSFFWAWLAAQTGAKRAILISLVWWAGVVIFAYGFLREIWQAWILGAAIGFVLGGTQALSRSMYSLMIPKGREASFFSFYEISERGTSWMGPLVFSVVVASTGSFRQAILVLIFFFIVGGTILYFTDTDRAIHEAGQHLPEKAAVTEI